MTILMNAAAVEKKCMVLMFPARLCYNVGYGKHKQEEFKLFYDDDFNFLYTRILVRTILWA